MSCVMSMGVIRLEGCRLAVPYVFSDISVFNNPGSHGHRRGPMEAMKLHTFASEEPWISHMKWSDIREAVTNLVTNFTRKRVRAALMVIQKKKRKWSDVTCYLLLPSTTTQYTTVFVTRIICLVCAFNV